MKTVNIFVDGGCRNNNSNVDNTAAYAYVLRCEDKQKEFSKAVKNTTSNQMELMSVISALESLNDCAKNMCINIYSDSQYVVSGVTVWSKEWERTNFYQVKNSDLWKQLLEKVKQFSNINFYKVKGHSDNEGNILADTLCNKAMDNI